MKGVGVLSRRMSSATAPPVLWTRLGLGMRRAQDCPYGIYSELQFDEITLPEGDSMARYLVACRGNQAELPHTRAACRQHPRRRHLRQGAQDYQAPEGHWFQQVEASRGAFGVYIESHGDQKPWRVKFNSPCMNLAGIVPHAAEGRQDCRPYHHRRYLRLRCARYRPLIGSGRGYNQFK